MEAASADQRHRARVVAASVVQRATDSGVALPDDLRLWNLTGPAPDPGPVVARSEPLATVLEAATSATERRARGLHVTPAWLADHLVALALDGLAIPPSELTICDPACGGGAFLLAAARALHARGIDRAEVVRHHLWGADVDPVGLATAEAALALWAGEAPPAPRLVVGDALLRGRKVWSEPPSSGFAAVVGNPPFLNQLERATVRSAKLVDRLRRRFGSAVQPYTDTAWLFLLLGAELTRAGGRVVLVQPTSLVGARDAAAVRDALEERTVLRDLWVEDKQTFAAAVQVCAPILDVVPPAPGVAGVAGAAAARTLWADRLADAQGVPRVVLELDGAGERVGDRAEVTAGFRDEYYGLVPLIREAEPDELGRPLVTVGMLDWGRCLWGERPATFAKRRWLRPVVDASRADPADTSPAARGGARWIERVSIPKVVVATQTRVVEAAVDEVGVWVPSVPALTVFPRAGTDLWLLAAAISSPTATAWLLRRAPGTALGRDAIKIAARDLADLPLPRDTGAWDDAAAALRDYAATPQAVTVDRYAAAIATAYGASAELVAWWRHRLR